LIERSNDIRPQDGIKEAKGLRTVPPGLRRGIRLPAEKNRDLASSELYDVDGYESEAESPVTAFSLLGSFVD